MISLALAIACGLTIGMIFKVAAHSGLDRLSLITVNYAVAFTLSAIVTAFGEARFDPPPGLILMGAGTGALFILSFFVLALSTALAGMSLSLAVMRLSVVIPFGASWIIWNEAPTQAQLAAMGIAGVAFFLIARGGGSGGRLTLRSSLVLASLFLMGGTSDTIMKTFEEVFSRDHGRAAFTTMIFGMAFVTGSVLLAVRRQRRPDRKSVLWGAALGVVNFGSLQFLLLAISTLSGPFVFPAVNIGLVLGGAVLGVLVWRERLSRGNLVGLGLALAALMLLRP